MKKTTLIFFVSCILFIGNCFSQWVQQTSGTSSPLYDLSFINQNTGWACGEGGLVIKTTNGGTNWIQQNTGINNKPMYGIHAVDSNIVYCVGWFETIIKTTNGGANWQILRNGPGNTGSSFFKTYFLNSNTGWLLKNDYILRTTNGGTTFDSTYTIFSYLYDIYFKDENTGVLCGEGSLIMKSTDGGVNWNQITIPLGFEAPNFYRECFVGNAGWVIGSATNSTSLGVQMWKTSNFGNSWDSVSRVPYPFTHENYSVFFSSANTGWCGGTYGHIFKTTNGGYNWYEQTVPIDGFRGDLWFYNDSTGWAAGGGGYILKTSNGGTYLSVTPVSNNIPYGFKLYQNYPNPFNPVTKIRFEVPLTKGRFRGLSVKLQIFDILGKEIETLVNEQLKPGTYETKWDGSGYSSGTYFYMLSGENFSETKKLILVK